MTSMICRVLAIATIAALLLGCGTTPPSAATATVGAAPTATPASATPTLAPAIVTPVASPTAAPPGSMAAMSQTMFQLARQMGLMMAGDLTPAQMQSMMDQAAATYRDLSRLALQAPHGTAEARQMMAQTLDQMAALATQLRERASQLTPDQRKLASQQMQSLSLAMAQTMKQTQGISAQATQGEVQSLMTEMRQVQGTMSYVMSLYGIPTPTPSPASATATPTPVR